MENKEVKNPELFITKSDKEDIYGLVGIVGPELMFQRLGEFLAVMMEQDGFYVTKVDGDKVDTNLVEMEPYDGQVEEDSKEDMGEDTGIVSVAKNSVLIRNLNRQSLYNLLEKEFITPIINASEKAQLKSLKEKGKGKANEKQ